MQLKRNSETTAWQSTSGGIKKIEKYLMVFVSILAFGNIANAQGVQLPTNVGLPSSSSGITGIIQNLTSWLLAIFGFIAVISFVITGFMYFFAAGDDRSQEKAKKQMTWSIIGVVIGLVGLVVIYAVDAFLKAQSF